MVFIFAGISCLQAMSYATLPFAEEKKTFCLFFLEEHVDLYSKSVFLHCRKPIVIIIQEESSRFHGRSFLVSSFEIPGSKLYRSFGVPCLP